VVSFKVKLAVYFLLLSLLPVAAAFWGFSSVASQSETRRVDARLQGGLRAALAAYQERLDAAQVTAETLARDRAFQRALSRGDKQAVAGRLRGMKHVEVLTPYGLVVGRDPGFAAKRQVDVFTREGLIGTVIAFVRYDTDLAKRLRSLSGLPTDDAVAILDGTHIAAASPAVFGRLTLQPGVTRSVAIGGARYRALVAGSLEEDPLAGARLAVLSPQNLIDRANGSTRMRLLLFLVGSLLIVAIVAWLEGRSIVRTMRDLVRATHGIARGRLDERVPLRGRDEFAQLGRAFNDMADQLEERLQELEAERARLREAFARIGDALGATHDPAGLLQVVLETALQATGATGAVLVGDRGEHVEVGDPDAGPERLEVPLSAGQTSFGTLVLTGSGFSEEQKVTAISLAAQAVVALENARLHRIVEHQALVDPLTGLANRRRCEEALSVELARAERFGAPLAFVLADLDDFKAVNDDHGHPVGDVVLREFAAVLRENVREADLAGRWGGEEFVLLLPGTDAAGGGQLAERVRTALLERTILAPDGRRVEVTCSFGIADVAAGSDAGTLVGAADRALYRAKRGGKNRVETTAPLLRHP
jgi:diguanylate cyclase (GGDEF)-like protein